MLTWDVAINLLDILQIIVTGVTLLDLGDEADVVGRRDTIQLVF